MQSYFLTPNMDNNEMYNSFRLISDNFSRDSFEDFKPPESLMEMARSASKMYKEETTARATESTNEENSEVEVLIFKRKSDKVLEKEIKEADKILEEAEATFLQAKKRKEELQFMKKVSWYIVIWCQMKLFLQCLIEIFHRICFLK